MTNLARAFKNLQSALGEVIQEAEKIEVELQGLREKVLIQESKNGNFITGLDQLIKEYKNER